MMRSLFACLDIEHPMVAWAAYRGVLVSALTGHEYPNCPISVMLAGMLKSRNAIRLGNELALERVRQLRHPQCVSRLSGMYFFETQDAVERVADWGGHFSREYLAELGVLPNSVLSRHDSNWITLAPLDDHGHLASTDWVDAYWAGEQYPEREPVWEVIVSGRVAVFGVDLRKRAYEKIVAKFPMSVAILEMGRIAAHLDSDLGQSTAWLSQVSDTEFSLQYFLDMRDATNPAYLERLKGFEGPKNHVDLAVGGKTFTVPDFRDLSETFKIDEPFSKHLFVGVHGNKI